MRRRPVHSASVLERDILSLAAATALEASSQGDQLALAAGVLPYNEWLARWAREDPASAGPPGTSGSGAR